MNLFQCLAVSFICGVIEFDSVFAKDYYKILGKSLFLLFSRAQHKKVMHIQTVILSYKADVLVK